MSRLIIVEGNSNDKDNVRAIMVKGERGFSAYEIAVQNGYEGTEEEWKDSYINAENYYNKTETNNLLDEKTCIYDTVALMKADTNLKNGMIAKTLGYYEVNDGGEAEYKITTIESETDYQEELNNGLYATLIVNDYVTPEMFGAYGDGEHDDTIAIQFAIDNYDVVHLYNKTYIAKDINVVSDKSIIGEGSNISTLKGDGTTEGLRIYNNENTQVINVHLENINLTNYTYGISAINVRNSIFENVTCRECGTGARFTGGTWTTRLYNCRFVFNTYDGFECGLPITHPTLNTSITPDIATFDFYGCSFGQNGRYGISGWLRSFNFFGGYCENNGVAGVHLVNTSNIKSQSLLFSGFDIEHELVGYMFEATEGDHARANDIRIIGGQCGVSIREGDPVDSVAALLYFKCNQLAYYNVYNIEFKTNYVGLEPQDDKYYIYTTAGSDARKDIQADLDSSKMASSYLKTNLNYIIDNNTFNVNDMELPLMIVNDYFNQSNYRLEIPDNTSFTINIPTLRYVEKLKITTSSSATFTAFLLGQNITDYIQTQSKSNQTSDANNITTISFGRNASIIRILNKTGSAITITKIELTGMLSR